MNLELSSNDDDFFDSMESRPSLSQLFGAASTQRKGNSTLNNEPTKQMPASLADATKSWSVHMAKLVTAYKDSATIGKLGLALLRNAYEEYKIVLYKTKNNIVATCTLRSDSETTRCLYRQQMYLQFYDDTKVYWSLQFDKHDDEKDFFKTLAVLAVKIVDIESKTEAKFSLAQETQSLENAIHENGNVTVTMALEESKTSLVSRMAKMGQKLPNLKAPSKKVEFSDESTDTEVISTSLAVNNRQPPAVMPRNSSRMITQKPHITSAVGVYSSRNLPLQMQEAQFMQIMLTETRTQNTEMRMNINKLESKMEKVLDKLDAITDNSSGSTSNTNKENEILELEEKLLAVKKENYKLKQALEESKQKTQQSMNAFIAKHENQLQNFEVICTQDWHEFGEELLAKITTLQADLKQVNARNEDLTVKLREKIHKLGEQSRQLEEKQDKLDNLSLELSDVKMALDNQNRIANKLQENMQDLTHKLAEKQIRQSLETKRAVKDIMNSLYNSIASQLSDLPASSTSNEQVLSIIGKVIKYETLQAMQ